MQRAMVDHRSVVAFIIMLLLLFESTFQQLQSWDERIALLELRSSLGLRSVDWPIKGDPCLAWNGITCENGSVVGINISGFRRTRIGRQNPRFAVESLLNLTRLVSFNASRFLLPGSIPDWLGQRLLTLQVLDLRFCSINGFIPRSLGNLTTLTSLYLSDNGLSGTIPSSLGQLTHLSVLDLSRNSFTGSIPTSFASLANLTSLDISSNYLSGSVSPGLGTLSNLQVLNLSSNSLTSSVPSQLGDLHSLVDLDLSMNSLSGSVPTDLRGLRRLRRMLIGNNFLSGSLPQNLFPALSQLEVIVLRHNNLTGPLPNVLWSMAQLHLLDVSANNFTGTLPTSFNANASTAELNVSQNSFYGVLTPIIRRFSSLDLSGNYFEGRVPVYVPDNGSLVSNCLQNVPNQRDQESCVSFYASRGLSFDNFGRPNTPPPAPKASQDSNRRTILLAAILGGVGLIVLLVVLVLIILCARKRGSTNQRGVGVGPSPTETTPPPPGVSINFSSLGDSFTYHQLLLATNEFSDANLIKNGHSGDLFRGVLEGEIPVVIKRVDLRSGKKDSYLVELDLLSKISHARLVPLLGHCLDDENHKFLVYKYMPNGDLSSSLYRKTNTEDDLQSLDWITRLKIATGAAEGLAYLHQECTPPLVHRGLVKFTRPYAVLTAFILERASLSNVVFQLCCFALLERLPKDIQASSILLDDKFEVRLGSLSEVCAQEGDTHHSRFTRLLRLPQSSEQSTSGSLTSTCAYDVYCFGKVLLELVTGKLGISSSSDDHLKELLDQTLPYISIYDKELVTKIVDPSLIVDEDLLEEVWAMAIVARSCLNPKPSRRPLMRVILRALENPLKVVREENTDSGRLRTTSARGSWSAAFFGSWRHSSSDVAAVPANSAAKGEGSLRRYGTNGSQGSCHNSNGEHSSSHRRHSQEIFPEPSDGQDVERQERNEAQTLS